MRYAFLIFRSEPECFPAGPGRWSALRSAHFGFIDDAVACGILRAAERLQTSDTATTVRLSHGEIQILDGPFEKTTERLAVYYILDCRDLDDALRWAQRMLAGGTDGCVEIRPVAPPFR